MGWIERYRHTRGFGVHSPSAYRMIREVLCPSSRYGFYAYRYLRQMARSRDEYESLCLLFRVLVDLRPSKIAFVGPSKNLEETVRMACPNAEIYSKTPDFVVVGNYLNANAHTAPRMFFCDPSMKLFGECLERMESGHAFIGKRHALIYGHPNLPRQIFTLNI